MLVLPSDLVITVFQTAISVFFVMAFVVEVIVAMLMVILVLGFVVALKVCSVI